MYVTSYPFLFIPAVPSQNSTLVSTSSIGTVMPAATNTHLVAPATSGIATVRGYMFTKNMHIYVRMLM